MVTYATFETILFSALSLSLPFVKGDCEEEEEMNLNQKVKETEY